MNRRSLIAAAIVLTAIIGAAIIGAATRARKDGPRTIDPEQSPGTMVTPAPAPTPTAAERLLEGYASGETEPMEDLRKLHRVSAGYFSVVKTSGRFSIGGNEDFAAALRGENPNGEVFVPPGHPVFAPDGRLVDRWGTPVEVHPAAWGKLEFRSAGPDRTPYTDDDLALGGDPPR